MGKIDFGGCMQGMKRANSKDLAGWVEGSVTHLKSGKRQVIFENGQVVCFIVGEDDIIIKKEEVASLECVAQNIKEKYGDKYIVCNSYAVTLTNGEYGTFTIFAGKAAEFTILLKK